MKYTKPHLPYEDQQGFQALTWLFLPNPSKLLKERFRGQESAEGLLFARPKRRFRWIEEPFEGDARTVVRIKVPKHGRCDEFLH